MRVKKDTCSCGGWCLKHTYDKKIQRYKLFHRNSYIAKQHGTEVTFIGTITELAKLTGRRAGRLLNSINDVKANKRMHRGTWYLEPIKEKT